jgi:hypothetical protein
MEDNSDHSYSSYQPADDWLFSIFAGSSIDEKKGGRDGPYECSMERTDDESTAQSSLSPTESSLSLSESIATVEVSRKKGRGKNKKAIRYTKRGSKNQHRINSLFWCQKELLSALIDEYKAKVKGPESSSSALMQSLPPRQNPPPHVSALFDQYYAGKTKTEKRKEKELVKTLVKKYEPSRTSSNDDLPSRNPDEIIENSNKIFTSSFDGFDDYDGFDELL